MKTFPPIDVDDLIKRSQTEENSDALVHFFELNRERLQALQKEVLEEDEAAIEKSKFVYPYY